MAGDGAVFGEALAPASHLKRRKVALGDPFGGAL